LQAEQVKREEIEKRQAALKAERERKEAIEKHINSTRNTIFYSSSTYPRKLI
jgi:glutamyl-tRNA reductase